MATRQQYKLTGKYLNADDARKVVGYHIQSLDGTKQGKYTLQQIIFLVGRGQISNCSAQIYEDKVLLKGVGMSLDSLPTKKIKIADDSTNRVATAPSNPVPQQPVRQAPQPARQVQAQRPTPQPARPAQPQPAQQEPAANLQSLIQKYGTHYVKAPAYNINFVDKNAVIVESISSEKNWKFIVDLEDSKYYYLKQADYPDAYVIRTPKTKTLEEFVTKIMPFMGYMRDSDVTYRNNINNSERDDIRTAMNIVTDEDNLYGVNRRLRGIVKTPKTVTKSELQYFIYMSMLTNIFIKRYDNVIATGGKMTIFATLPSIDYMYNHYNEVAFQPGDALPDDYNGKDYRLAIIDGAFISEVYEAHLRTIANYGLHLKEVKDTDYGTFNGIKIVKAVVDKRIANNSHITLCKKVFADFIKSATFILVQPILDAMLDNDKQIRFVNINSDEVNGLQIHYSNGYITVPINKHWNNGAAWAHSTMEVMITSNGVSKVLQATSDESTTALNKKARAITSILNGEEPNIPLIEVQDSRYFS